MVSDVDVSWDADGFDKACESASLAVDQLLMDPLGQILPRFLLLLNRLDGQFDAIFVDSVLEEFSTVIAHMISHLVFKVESNHVAWHLWEHDVNVDVELVRVVRGLDRDIAGGLRL